MPELFFIAIIIILTILYLLERARADQMARGALEENQQKGWNILHQAIKKAQNIIGTAELEEIKLGISYTDESKKLSQIMAWAMKKYPCVRSAPHPTDGRRSIYFWQPATE